MHRIPVVGVLSLLIVSQSIADVFPDQDEDGFIDAIELRYAGTWSVTNPELTPDHGTPLMIGTTSTWGDFQRFPETDQAVAIDAGGYPGSEFVLVLKGDGRVLDWSAQADSIQQLLYGSEQWAGTHPREWRGIVDIEVAPFGVFGIDAEGDIHYCAELWAVDAVDGLHAVQQIETSHDSLIALTVGGNLVTAVNGWDDPLKAKVPELRGDIEFDGYAVRVAAGKGIFAVVSTLGDFKLWGTTAAIVAMDSSSFASMPILDFELSAVDHSGLAIRAPSASSIPFGADKSGSIYPFVSKAVKTPNSTGDFSTLYDRRLKTSASFIDHEIHASTSWQYVDVTSTDSALFGITHGGTPLEWAVAEALGAASPVFLDDDDWNRLNDLSLLNTPVLSLQGIERASNLQSLSIEQSYIADLSPLMGLDDLEYLRVVDSPILDLSALEQLSLRQLELEGLPSAAELDSAKGFDLLRAVARLEQRFGTNVGASLHANFGWHHQFDPQIAAWIGSALESFGSVSTLDANYPEADGLELSDLRGLSLLDQLEVLRIPNQNVVDLSELADLPQLWEVDLTNNPVVDLSPLLSLRSLHEVDITDTGAAELLANASEEMPAAIELRAVVAELERRGVNVINDGWTARDDWHLHFAEDTAAAIRDYLNVDGGELTFSQLQQLKEFNVDARYDEEFFITDLSGLQYAWQLEEVKLIEQGVTDIAPLKYLPNLYRVSVIHYEMHDTEPRLSDLSPLAGHPALEEIYLMGTNVLDISPVCNVPFLQYLELNSTFADELYSYGDEENPVAIAIREEVALLEASGVQVIFDGESRNDWWRIFEPALALAWRDDFRGEVELSDLEQATDLSFSQAGIRDLSGMELAYQVVILNLNDNAITDLKPLADATKLSTLYLDDNPVADLSPVLSLQSLGQLNIGGTFAAELYQAGLGSSLHYNSVTRKLYRQLSAWEAAGGGLNYLAINREDWWCLFAPELADVLVEALGGGDDYALNLNDLGYVRTLSATRDDLRPIAGLTGIQYLLELEEVNLPDQAISDLSPLSEVPTLTKLDLSNSDLAQWPINRVSDLSPLASSLLLNNLNIENTDVLDLDPLLDLPSLSSLLIDGTFAADLIMRGASESPRAMRAQEIAQQFSLAPTSSEREDWWRVFDPALGSALAAEVGWGEGALSLNAIEGLTSLSAAEQGIVSLRNIDLAYRFDDLNLSSNPLEDLSPLAGLLQLQDLNLAYCSLFRGSRFDAEPLASIRSLQDLDLSHNYLLDIEALLALPLLQDVNLSSTYVSDDSENPAYWIYKVLRAREVDVTLGESPLGDYSFLFEPALAAAIREQVGDGVGWSQLQQNLTDLDASGRGIQSLRGLELCTNLESLSLDDNLIADLSPLSELTKLTHLDLGVDVDAYPEGNPFKDLSPLANLWSLESLNLQGCGATDFSLLGSLPSLASVNVEDTLLQSGDSIVARLEAFGIAVVTGGDVQFSRILSPSLYAALEAEDLLSLDISVMQLEDHGISSLDGIGIFQNLEQLNVGGNRITDLSPLAGLPLLHTLDLNGDDYYYYEGYWEEGTYNAVSDLSVLTTLSSLSTFNARGNHISNIEPLLDCPTLSSVNLEDNFLLMDDGAYGAYGAASPAWIFAQQLEARGVNIEARTDRTDWDRLFPDPVLADYFRAGDGQGMSGGQLARIKNLHLTEPVTDLTGLEILYNLETLNLSNCYAQDLSPLSNLSNLTSLTLAREDETELRLIEDLSPLLGLSSLEELNLQGQGVSNIDVLLEIQTLQNVNLSGNYLDTREGSSVDAVLQQMPEHTDFDVSDQRDIWNHISDAGLERAIRNQLNLSPDQAITQADWEALRLLVAKGYAIEDIDSLALASELEVAVLAGNIISDPSVLADLERLGLIDLSNAPEVFPELENAVTDLSSFAGLTNLERLYLKNNQVADVSPLLQMRALNYLMLDGNPLDLRENSDTVRLLEALIARGTNVFYDDRYRSGLAEVQDNPQDYNLYEEAQLRGLALGKPTLEQVDGSFQLQLDVFESTDLIEWLPGQGSFQEVDGQLIWTPTNPGATKFYSIEAQ
ncbi:hypothetical protein QEH52_18865 [Coraliomargarita sp. SDUM461003]|uniref:Leucine-rich repeat domain-containing protein n=1 Tax=Thalassobacterium maritimum TaxID=3041265 RepID=A0ABU1AZM3_9BACT|nr:leucine-rich repeat domain-containing protein [Coraliomargarita sp. SDUM461003]MDQ8209593.1 hypothetical protein [Coraliomargarita sp. SDUM461003]